jgi:WD40 repeat protein
VLKRKLGKPGTPLVAAEISPQGDKVVTADASGHITVWSLADGRALQTIYVAAGTAVNDVHFSPDGSTILAACTDGKARTWNAQTGQPELTIAEETVPGEMPGMGAPFRSDLASGTPIQAGMLRVEYSPDGSFIAGANQGINVLVWDAKTGKQLLRLEGHTGRIASLAFSSDGTRLGSTSEDGTARIWDLGLENRSPAEIKQEIAEFGQKSSR